MKTTPSVLTFTDRNISAAQEVLEEAKTQGFESVVILGFKEGCVHICSSQTKSRLEMIGAIEVAKQYLWTGS